MLRPVGGLIWSFCKWEVASIEHHTLSLQNAPSLKTLFQEKQGGSRPEMFPLLVRALGVATQKGSQIQAAHYLLGAPHVE